MGSGAGLGLVPVGSSAHYQVVGLQPLVVAATHRDQVVDVGGSSVSVPFLHVVEFASVHGCAALETASVPDRYCESLGRVPEPLVAAQPEGTTGPVEDHAGQLGVGRERLEDLAGYGADPDDLDLPVRVGAVHYAYRGNEDELGGGLGLDVDLLGEELAGERAAAGEQLVHHVDETLLGVRTSSGSLPSAPSRRRW